MALFGGNKEELIVALAEAKAEVKYLREQVDDLRARLDRTQDALISKEAPEAYADYRAEKEEAKAQSPEALERQEKARKQARADQRLIELTEEPLFMNAEEMQQILNRPLMSSLSPESLHEDSES